MVSQVSTFGPAPGSAGVVEEASIVVDPDSVVPRLNLQATANPPASPKNEKVVSSQSTGFLYPFSNWSLAHLPRHRTWRAVFATERSTRYLRVAFVFFLASDYAIGEVSNVVNENEGGHDASRRKKNSSPAHTQRHQPPTMDWSKVRRRYRYPRLVPGQMQSAPVPKTNPDTCLLGWLGVVENWAW